MMTEKIRVSASSVIRSEAATQATATSVRGKPPVYHSRMHYQTLTFEARDHVAWITLNRPEALNALNLDGVRELYDAANHCSADESIRAVVLTGSGDRAFCAGGDVVDFAARGAVELLVKEMTAYLHLAISRFAWMRAPLIGAINGVAAGGGFSLALACDLVIAADTAKFTSIYTQIGFTPDGSSTFYLPRLVGFRRAMELYLTNRTLSASEALEWGLVNKVVPAAELLADAKTLAQSLAKGPTRAHGGIKKLLQLSVAESLESQMERESRFIAEMSASADGREGVRAFVEKRRPTFTGQ
jgi:2-(1,2-epoxy-1,2-dihydrophenyl)acetyl-CoA isomerase